MDIDKTATNNKLLGSTDNLSVYMALFQAHNNDKKITVNEIEKYIFSNYNIEPGRTKTWRILKLFMDNEIVNKEIDMSGKSDKYYLIDTIFAPKYYTPIPTYQFLLLAILTPVISYLYLFSNNSAALWVALISFINIMIVITLHYISFDVIKLNYNTSTLKKNKFTNGVTQLVRKVKTKYVTH